MRYTKTEQGNVVYIRDQYYIVNDLTCKLLNMYYEKKHISEIANELKIQSKDVIEFLKEKNILKKTASSAIEDDVIDMVRGKFNGGKSEKKDPGKSAIN